MSAPPALRRPVFIYGQNHVGGAEYFFLRRAECAARLGLRPVIVTVPGPMDARYRKVAQLIHVDARILSHHAFTPAMAGRVADEIVDLIGQGPFHIEATTIIDTYFAWLLAARTPGSDYSLLIIRPATSLQGGWPSWEDMVKRPWRCFEYLLGEKDNGVLAKLASSGRVLSVNRPCADDAAKIAGLGHLEAVMAPVILPEPIAVTPSAATDRYLLSVSRLDGTMKVYVLGLIDAFAVLRREHSDLRLIIVGDGLGMPSAKNRCLQAGVANSVDFLGTLSPAELAPIYAGASVFVGMGTAACEAAMYGAPVVLAVAYRPEGVSPGYFGAPGVEGFGEDVPSQPALPFLGQINPLLKDASLAASVSRSGQEKSLRDHHPEAAAARMRALLSRPAQPPVPHPWPMPRWSRFFTNLLASFVRKSIVREA